MTALTWTALTWAIVWFATSDAGTLKTHAQAFVQPGDSYGSADYNDTSDFLSAYYGYDTRLVSTRISITLEHDKMTPDATPPVNLYINRMPCII